MLAVITFSLPGGDHGERPLAVSGAPCRDAGGARDGLVAAKALGGRIDALFSAPPEPPGSPAGLDVEGTAPPSTPPSGAPSGPHPRRRSCPAARTAGPPAWNCRWCRWMVVPPHCPGVLRRTFRHVGTCLADSTLAPALRPTPASAGAVAHGREGDDQVSSLAATFTLPPESTEARALVGVVPEAPM